MSVGKGIAIAAIWLSWAAVSVAAIVTESSFVVVFVLMGAICVFLVTIVIVLN